MRKSSEMRCESIVLLVRLDGVMEYLRKGVR